MRNRDKYERNVLSAEFFKRERKSSAPLTRTFLVLLLSGTAAVGMSGCSALFPEEEEDRKIKLVEEAETIEYDMEAVTVTDIVNSQKVYANYQQSREENVCFHELPNNGGWVKKVFVKKGDEVAVGDPLIQLDIGDVPEKLEQLEYSIANNERQAANIREMAEYDKKDAAISLKYGYMDSKAYNERIKEIQKNCEDQVQGYEDSLYIQRLTRDKYQKMIEESYVYAQTPGVVSSIRDNLVGSEIKVDQELMKIIDTSECYFLAETPYAQHFTAGDVIELDVGSTKYETTVAFPEDGKENVVLFLMNNPNADIKLKSQGTCTVILGQVHDALAVSQTSVGESNGKYYVYQLDENGIRKTTEVKVGISGAGKIQILEGLKAGDMIISD